MKVLSIRGGGLKGLIPACILARFEHDSGKKCREVFDMIAGTSTGGILAVALGLGLPAQEIVNFYLTDGPKIFARRWGHMLGLFNDKFSAVPLREALDRRFGEGRKIGECKTRVMVTAARKDNGTSAFFKSWKHPNILAIDACLSTSAAPSFFESHFFKGLDDLKDGHMIDGGVFAQNPCSYALTEAQKLAPAEAHRLVDLECASIPWGGLSKLSGLLSIAGRIPDIFMDCGADAAAHQCEVALGDGYLRISPKLMDASPKMDDASDKNLKALCDAARLQAPAFSRQILNHLERKTS